MRLIGTKPPPTWPIKVFWLLVIIHAPMIALILVTNIVHGTLLSMIEFWLVTVPLYFLSLLLDPLHFLSAIIAAFLIWYALQFDWAPFWNWLLGGGRGPRSSFVRGRDLISADDFRNRLAIRRKTLDGRTVNSDRRISGK